jgi:mediator of replication checkpoint protein 1
LLADLEDDSDDDSPLKETGSTSILPLSEISLNARPGSRQDSGVHEEDQPVKPRGSLASRLFASSRRDSANSTTKVREENAYERIKKQLLGGQQEDSTKPDQAQSMADSREDEEDAPIRSRKRQHHVSTAIESEGEVLQSPNVHVGNSSGLFLSPGTSPIRKERDKSLADPISDLEDSEAELPEEPGKNIRFLELVQRKKQERLEKEAREQHQRKEKEDRLMKEAAAVIGMDEEDSEDNTERRLTQQSRPTRKASKKAIEELKRETQRMTRNMQLTHEARTKKKITKQSLFARFNYNPSTEVGEEMAERTVREEKTGSSDKGSDAEALHSTPPTSPPSFNGSPEKGKETFAAIAPFEKRKVVQENDVEEELPTMDDLITEQHAPRKRSQEKESSLNIGLVSLEAGVSKPTTTKERPRNLSSRRTLSKRSTAVDSESDLEVLPKGKKLSIWDRKPQQNQAHSASLQALRTLANLTSPSKQRARAKDMTLGELQTSLQQRARQQAKKERDERLQQLRDRGVIIQTAEERAKEEADVLDILARAREADSKLSKKEKAAAERDHDSGPKGDSDDEEEWNEGKSQTGTELSGDSETEGDGDDEDEEDDVEVGDLEEEEDLDQSPERNVPAMVDIQASEDDMDSADAPQDEDGDDNKFLDDGEKVVSSDARDQITVEKRKPRRALVLSDDEEDEMEVMTSNPKTTTTPVSVKKTTIPGLPTGDEVPLGLTQIFAGTMDESPTQEQLSQPPSRALDQEQDPLAFLRQLPDSDLPELDSRLDQDPHACVPDSQTRKDESQNQTESSRPDINLRDSQSQAGPLYVQDSFVLPSPSQYSEFPDPTQDVGFQNSSPIFDRFANPPTSTMDTVLLPADIPAPRKKSRLVKRAVIPDLSDDEIAARDVEPDNQDGEFLVSSDIFDVMRKAAEDKAKAPVEFNKKKSNAKGMVQEQAEESEDEYAGLGGASDDESGSEDAEFAREMVDDNGPDADERQLAAFYA